MREDLLFFRQDIQVEPLVDRWYAWSHLISPSTCARNVTERHLKIMESYISAPNVHVKAVKNPQMLGGPFIDHPINRMKEIRQLRDNTAADKYGLCALSTALAQLDQLLRSTATGHSMHPLYAAIPQLLRGYVELVYDVNNTPSFRMIESLLYASEYFSKESQSFALKPISQDDRPFILSTPRLSDSETTELAWPFDDRRVDGLFRLGRLPKTWNTIREEMGWEHRAGEKYQGLFTQRPPRPYDPYTGTGIRWRYFGHACILVETQAGSILFDPVLSYTYESAISRYTYEDLPEKIDYVVITHNHQDHILLETLLQIRHKIGGVIVPKNGSGTLADPSLRLMLESIGFKNVYELGEMDVLDTKAGLSLTGIPFLGEHSDLAISTKLAYCVRLRNTQLLFAADSCNIAPEMYRHIKKLIGAVDVLFVGMECDGAPLSWLYGPLLLTRPDRAADESRRLSGSNFEQAYDLVDCFACKEVYVYAMGQEPWLNHVMSLKYTDDSRPIVESERLLSCCRERGIIAERLFGEKEIVISGS